jgi:hypothetical protein
MALAAALNSTALSINNGYKALCLILVFGEGLMSKVDSSITLFKT